MTWILLATAGQLLNAVVAILDKYIVTDERVMPRPFVYAFYTCLLTGFWVVIYFFSYLPGLGELGVPSFNNIERPSIQVVGMSFLAAYTLFMALVSMYSALRKSDASDVIPVIGAISAISSFGMNYLFLSANLTLNLISGIILLSIGTALVSEGRFRWKDTLHTIHSGLFFGLHYITMKGLFLETSFDDGFFWSRMGLVLFALSLLLVPSYFEKISVQTKETSRKGGQLVIATKILAGIAAFMILKATDWGDVSVVQALDGLKFVFILIIGFAIGSRLPFTAGENAADPSTFLRKALYVGVISVGYIMLFL